MKQTQQKDYMRRFVSLVIPSICVISACGRGAEQFEGVVNGCSVTDIVSDAVLFIDRPDGNGLSIFWGTGEPGTDQFTVAEMSQGEEKASGVELNFSGDFNFTDVNGDAVVIEHDAQLVRENNSYTGILDVRTSFTQGTAKCDVGLDLIE